MGDALKINPRSIDALSASGIILEGLKRKDEARGFFERALAIEPENKFIRGALAGNLAGQGRLSEAVPLYVKLTEDFPRDPASYRLLGIAYSLLGEESKAAEALQKYLDLARNEPPQMVEQMRQELQRIKTRLR
jgi:Flp pilus assembly protein TadD